MLFFIVYISSGSYKKDLKSEPLNRQFSTDIIMVISWNSYFDI